MLVASEHRPHPGDQLVETERLGQVTRRRPAGDRSVVGWSDNAADRKDAGEQAEGLVPVAPEVVGDDRGGRGHERTTARLVGHTSAVATEDAAGSPGPTTVAGELAGELGLALVGEVRDLLDQWRIDFAGRPDRERTRL